MRGTPVLVRAYADRPFVGQIYSVGPKGLRVARPDADLNNAATLAAGVPWEDAFEIDVLLIRQLNAATRQSERARLWINARPFRRDNGNEGERRFVSNE